MNPYLPTYEYVPDGEPHVFGDRLYIFGSHDRFGGTGFCENDYVCWSCPAGNLSDWKFEGTIYRKDQDPKNRLVHSTMYAPDVCKGPDGRYYLYYGLNSIPLTGVAVCDTPAGKYEFYGYVRHKSGKLYGREKGDGFPFDPAVLNDNGNIYLYSGFSPSQKGLRFAIDLISRRKGALGNQVIRLADDMLTVLDVRDLIPGTDNSKGTGFEGHEFYEASSIRKYDDIYYFVYSSVLSHELCLATSKYPDKGFEFMGILHSNCDIGFNGNTRPLSYWGNNHGGIEKIGNNWYIFGHRHTNCRECNRQGVAEKLKTDPEGNFIQAEMTCMGPEGKYLNAGKYQTGICCNLYSGKGAVKSTFFRNKSLVDIHPYITQDGEDRENSPCIYIKNMRNGSVAGYKYFSCKAKEIEITVCGKGVIEVSTDNSFSSICASFEIDSTQWKNYCSPLSAGNEIFALYFRYTGNQSCDFLDFSIND